MKNAQFINTDKSVTILTNEDAIKLLAKPTKASRAFGKQTARYLPMGAIIEFFSKPIIGERSYDNFAFKTLTIAVHVNDSETVHLPIKQLNVRNHLNEPVGFFAELADQFIEVGKNDKDEDVNFYNYIAMFESLADRRFEVTSLIDYEAVAFDKQGRKTVPTKQRASEWTELE